MIEGDHLNDPFNPFWKRRELSIENVRYSFLDQNPEGKSAILFLHGFPDLAWGWRYQIDEFCKDHRCIAPDMIGYGESDSPMDIERYTFKSISKDLVYLMEFLKIGKFIVFCHDWGGMVGWRLCQYYPERVLCLVSMCTAFQKPKSVFVPLEEIVKKLSNLQYQITLATSAATRFLDDNVDQLFDHIFYHHSFVLDHGVSPLISAMKGFMFCLTKKDLVPGKR